VHTVNECLAPTSRPTSAVGSSKSKLSASERQWAEYYRLMEQSQLENITVRPVPKPPAPRPRTALEREAKHGRCRLQPSHKLRDRRSPVKSPESTEGMKIVEEHGRAMLEEIEHDEVLRRGESRGFHSPARQREEDQVTRLGLAHCMFCCFCLLFLESPVVPSWHDYASHCSYCWASHSPVQANKAVDVMERQRDAAKRMALR